MITIPFGYMPNRKFGKDLILRIFGYPNVIRRIQAPVIIRMLEPKRSEVVLDAGCGGGFFTYEIAKICVATRDNPMNNLLRQKVGKDNRKYGPTGFGLSLLD